MKKLIVLEGLDGAGKSTQINLLTQYLVQHDIVYRYMHFPRTDSSSPIYGEMVAHFLKGDYGNVQTVNPYLVALLYAGDRDNAKTQMSEWLDNNYLVLLDRYVYSNMAFQGAKFPTIDEKRKLHSWIHDLEFNHYRIPQPTLSIYLHMPFSFISGKLKDERTGDDRLYLQGKEDIHENNLDLQARVEKEYLRLVNENEDFQLVECFDENHETLRPEKIHEKIISLLKEKDII